MSPPFEKKTGLSHLFAATRYSAQGFMRAIGESAFRHELIMGLVLLIAMVMAGCAIAELVMALILFLVLLAIEAVNTAIEEVIDKISPEFSKTAQHAKDLGSFAVFCLIIANLVYAGVAIIRALTA